MLREMSGTRIREDETITLEGDVGTVTLRKAYTPNGQLLEVSSPDTTDSRRLDAIELESVTWQDRDTLHAAMERREGDHGDTPGEATEFADSPTQLRETMENPDLTITNEYAEVRISAFSADGAEWCGLVSPKLGYYLRLTPSELEGITELPHTIFSDFLQRPYGPE